MSKLRCHISISADGFVAGPNQSEENPLGEGGERLHDWIVPLAAWREAHDKQGGELNESARIVEESRENIGAGVMGRNMFGPIGGGDWGDEQWMGWWGDNPPYHNDVFVVTHHPRESVEMQGGTTYHFVTDGIEPALQRAKESADGKDVMLWGGAQIINQYLAAGLLDELELHIVPLLLGGGARLFDNLGAPRSSSSRSGRSRRPASRTSSTGWCVASSSRPSEGPVHVVRDASTATTPLPRHRSCFSGGSGHGRIRASWTSYPGFSLWTTTRSATGDACFLAKEQSSRTAWRTRSLLPRTRPGSAIAA